MGRLHERTAATSATDNREHINQSIRLPSINIPTFEGDLDNWYPYKDQFSSIVHSNKSSLPQVKLQKASIPNHGVNDVNWRQLLRSIKSTTKEVRQ